jgi:hypothetical protein
MFYKTYERIGLNKYGEKDKVSNQVSGLTNYSSS